MLGSGLLFEHTLSAFEPSLFGVWRLCGRILSIIGSNVYGVFGDYCSFNPVQLCDGEGADASGGVVVVIDVNVDWNCELFHTQILLVVWWCIHQEQREKSRIVHCGGSHGNGDKNRLATVEKL